MPEDSIPIYVPAEYLDEVSMIIRSGLKTSNLSAKVRKELTGWWTAESSLLENEMEKNR